MSLTLTIDGERWRTHLSELARRTPGLVPVAKGNGYGLSVGRLARRTQWLSMDTIAVGTYDEIDEVVNRFHGSILVLAPWRPGTTTAVGHSSRLIHTVGRLSDLVTLLEQDPQARIVLERRTSMMRHGFDARDLREAAHLMAVSSGQLEGVAFHLPLSSGSYLGEALRLMTDVVAAGLTPSTVWVSHLSPADLGRLRAAYAEFTIRPRIGTDLWLGARDSFRVTSEVLDLHEVARGDVFGYRARSAPKAGHLLVVSGGTTHGIGLESPSGELTFKTRAATIARGGLDAAGFVRSPFIIDGKQRLFAEPPHMQASMLFLPQGARVPRIGEEIEVRVRYTTTTFDRVVTS